MKSKISRVGIRSGAVVLVTLLASPVAASVIVSLNNPGSTALHEVWVEPGETFIADLNFDVRSAIAQASPALRASLSDVFAVTSITDASLWSASGPNALVERSQPGIRKVDHGAPGTGVLWPWHDQPRTVHTLERIASVPPGSAHWATRVGSVQAPLGVKLDPDGPVWKMAFTAQPGEPILPNEIIAISEHLLVQGEPSWTGWQSRIMTDRFQWCPAVWPYGPGLALVDVDGSPVQGLTVQYAGPLASASFDPLLPEARLRVNVRLMYTGTEPFAGALEIEQFPAPEPSTLAASVLLLGTAILLRR